MRPILRLDVCAPRTATGALALLFAVSLSGCISMAPAPESPTLVEQLPDEFAARDASAAGDYTPQKWWTAFEDPVLDDLVERALLSNLDIVESVARLEQAKAQARVAQASLVPSTSANGAASGTNSSLDGLAFGDFGGSGRLENETYTLDLGVSYEFDLFGRVRNDYRAARQDAIASAQDLKTVQLSAAGETITAYFDYVDAARQIALNERTVEVLGDRAERTEERFARGLVDSFEVYQIQQDLRSTESSLPQLRSSLVATQSRLALLLGTYPGELDAVLSQPLRPRLVFEPVPSGLPIDLLAQRPDVAAAYERLEGARLRIGARRAERFPSLSFNASLGTQGGTPGSAFDFADNWATSLASSLVAPLFDGGRITANIASARATYDQQAAAYASAVIGAFGEVESAMADYEQQRDRYALVAAQLAEAKGSLDLQSRRFEAGVGSYLSYLDALRTFYAVETSLSSAARSTALARLSVHRALGGDWVDGVEPQELDMQRADKDDAPDEGEAL